MLVIDCITLSSVGWFYKDRSTSKEKAVFESSICHQRKRRRKAGPVLRSDISDSRQSRVRNFWKTLKDAREQCWSQFNPTQPELVDSSLTSWDLHWAASFDNPAKPVIHHIKLFEQPALRRFFETMLRCVLGCRNRFIFHLVNGSDWSRSTGVDVCHVDIRLSDSSNDNSSWMKSLKLLKP